MRKQLRYSVLRYSPSKIAGEKINLGIIFADKENDKREFRHTTKFRRIAGFDDELNMETLKNLLNGIKTDVEPSSPSDAQFDLDSYIQFFINDFNFDEPKSIYYDDWDETVEKINRIYFRFDYEKSKRPSKKDEFRFLSDLISARTDELKWNRKMEGAFNESVTYDLVVGGYKIKMLDFDNKDLTKLVNTAKAWAFNCMADTTQKTIIIYRYSDEGRVKDDQTFDSIKKIFEYVDADFLNMEEGIEKIQTIKNLQ